MKYRLTQPRAAHAALLPDVVCNRTIVTGAESLRSKFAASVAAAVQDKKVEFLGRKATTNGRVLLLLPELGYENRYSEAVKAAGGAPVDIDFVTSVPEFCAENLAEYALVIVDQISPAFMTLRTDDKAPLRDVVFPRHLATAKNLILVNNRVDAPAGSYNQASRGEAQVLDFAATHIEISDNRVTVSGQAGNAVYDTTGKVWQPPKVIAPEVAGWAAGEAFDDPFGIFPIRGTNTADFDG